MITEERNQPEVVLRSFHRAGESGRVKIMFFPGCLVLSILLSVGGTILINLLLRLFD